MIIRNCCLLTSMCGTKEAAVMWKQASMVHALRIRRWHDSYHYYFTTLTHIKSEDWNWICLGTAMPSPFTADGWTDGMDGWMDVQAEAAGSFQRSRKKKGHHNGLLTRHRCPWRGIPEEWTVTTCTKKFTERNWTLAKENDLIGFVFTSAFW